MTIDWKMLELKDFLSWERLALNLTPAHPMLILGDNRDNAGASSNGSGKSAIFDGLIWTLFGTTLRGLSGDEIIRADTEKAQGKVKWRHEGKTYEVFRSRKAGETDLTLTVGDKKLSGLTPTITQKRIESALGLNYETFVAACIFGQDVTRWATYSDKDQKLILERLIGLDQWDRILKEVRAGKQAQGLAQQLSEATYAQAERDLKDIAQQEQELDREEQDWQHTVTARAEELSEELERVSTAAKVAARDLDDKQKVLDDLKAQSSGFLKQREERNAMLAEQSRLQAKIYSLTEILKGIDEDQAELDLHMVGDECPVCDRPLDEKATEAANRAHQNKIKAFEAQRKDHESEKAELEAKVLPELPPEPDLEMLNQTQAAAEALSEVQTTLHKAESRKIQLLAEVDKLSGKSEAFAKSRKILADQKAKLEAKQADMSKEVDEAHKNKLSYDWLEKAFGPQGIRSYLLESILPRFEEWANDVLRQLGPNLRLELRAQSALKSGELREKLSCDVYLDGRVAPYESLSAGERQRVDVSIALALETLSAERTPIGLAVFDEIFERMDPEGCERVARLLKKRFSKTGCWVITHNDALKSLFSTVLLVRKESGISTVVGPALRVMEAVERVGTK